MLHSLTSIMDKYSLSSLYKLWSLRLGLIRHRHWTHSFTDIPTFPFTPLSSNHHHFPSTVTKIYKSTSHTSLFQWVAYSHLAYSHPPSLRLVNTHQTNHVAQNNPTDESIFPMQWCSMGYSQLPNLYLYFWSIHLLVIIAVAVRQYHNTLQEIVILHTL